MADEAQWLFQPLKVQLLFQNNIILSISYNDLAVIVSYD